MSIAHAWFGRVISEWRGRSGRSCNLAQASSFADGDEQALSQSASSAFYVPAAGPAPLGGQPGSQQARAGEGELQMQPVQTSLATRSLAAPDAADHPHSARLMFRASACLVIDRSCSRSIVALRSAIPPC